MNLWCPDQPYNDLPLLPPAQDIETRRILKACIPAHAKLAELKRVEQLVPNPVLVNSIPLLEAQASSEIENIVTTTDRLFMAAASQREADDPATRETLRYREALWQAHRNLGLKKRQISTATAIEICSVLRGVEMEIRRVPGTSLVNETTGEIVYTPPAGDERIRELMKNWEDFLHGNDEIDPLIRMAVLHYQFEAIHPFTDGNGRTGRILNVLYLVRKRMLSSPILYLSGFIIRNKADYYSLLRGVTADGRWEDWIVYILKGIEETCQWTIDKIEAIRGLMDFSTAYIRDRAPHLPVHELVELLFLQTHCRIGDVVDRGIAKRQTASVYLKTLVEIGVLLETSTGREKLFLHAALIDLLKSNDNSFDPYRPPEPIDIDLGTLGVKG